MPSIRRSSATFGAFVDLAQRHEPGSKAGQFGRGEQRDRGLTTAELIWVGPLSYYARAVGATIGRAFWQYEKNLNAPTGPQWLASIGLVHPEDPG
jgi:hypothetical protein